MIDNFYLPYYSNNRLSSGFLNPFQLWELHQNEEFQSFILG